MGHLCSEQAGRNTAPSLRLESMALEITYPIGALVLLVGLAIGAAMYLTRNKRKDAITEAATREQYEHPARYAETQHRFEEAAKRVDAEEKSR